MSIPFIEMSHGDHFYPRDHIALTIDEARTGSADTGDGVLATFPFETSGPYLLRIDWIEADGRNVVCTREGAEGYVHLDRATFVRYADEGRIVQLTRPLYEGPHRFTNRYTELEEHILYATPRRDSRTRQFAYLVESRRAGSVEHLLLVESELLKRAKPSEVHPEGEET